MDFQLKDDIKRAAWKESGVLVIDVNHGSLNAAERAFVENIGTKFYGKRKESKHERGAK